MFDEKWLSKGIEKNEIDIDHIISDEGVILLTASTNQLQKFVSKFSECEECLTDPIILSKH